MVIKRRHATKNSNSDNTSVARKENDMDTPRLAPEEITKLKKRQDRFKETSCETLVNVQEIEKLAKRQERFGTAKFSRGKLSNDEDVLKKRKNRFNETVSPSLVSSEAKEKLDARLKRFAQK